jgi:hypothetical protein
LSQSTQLDEITAVGDGLDGISLSKVHIEQLKYSKLSLSPSPPSAAALLRARQAQYPTNMLQSKLGFAQALSAETRSSIHCTLYSGIDKMKVQIEALGAVIQKELQHQTALDTLSMEDLYQNWKTVAATNEDSNHKPLGSNLVKGKANPSVAGPYPTKESTLLEDYDLF